MKGLRCLFRYRRQDKFSPGVSGDFVEFAAECDDQEEKYFNTKYPTCWSKFLHWLGCQ